MENKLKQKIQEGHYTLGTFIEIGSMNAIEALHNTGLDFLVIDGEHGHFDTQTITDQIRAAESNNITPLVRIGEISRAEIQRVLDAGALGLILPGLTTPGEVRKLVSLSKFPPIGQRGFSVTRASRWGASKDAQIPLADYMKKRNELTLILPQCENIELLEVIDEVAEMDGVDGIFIGPFDLSISMGIPGQFEHPEFLAAVRKIRNAVKKAGKLLMYFTTDPAITAKLAEQSFDGIALSLDTMILNRGYQELIAKAHESVQKTTEK